jgi:hypothetical protein
MFLLIIVRGVEMVLGSSGGTSADCKGRSKPQSSLEKQLSLDLNAPNAAQQLTRRDVKVRHR